jgi:hypothetical protein
MSLPSQTCQPSRVRVFALGPARSFRKIHAIVGLRKQESG